MEDQDWAEVARVEGLRRQQRAKVAASLVLTTEQKAANDARRAELLAEIQAEKELRDETLRGLSRKSIPLPSDKLGILKKPADPPMLPFWSAGQATNPFKVLVAPRDRERATDETVPRGVKIDEISGRLIDGTANLISLDVTTYRWTTRHGMRVSEAYSMARHIVKNGGLALVETRLADLKGTKNLVVTNHLGYTVPMMARPARTYSEKESITWLVVYDDQTMIQVQTDDHYHAPVPLPDDPVKAADCLANEAAAKLNIAKRLVLEGSYKGSKCMADKTPKCAILKGEVFSRESMLKSMPAPKADEYKRVVPQAMHVNKTSIHSEMRPFGVKASLDRAHFSRG